MAYAAKYAGQPPLEGPLRVIISARFEVPKSYSRVMREQMQYRPHTHKPDCDNIAKVILDALNRVAFKDDSQVARLIVNKSYMPGEAFASVMIDEMEGSEDAGDNGVHF